MTRSTPFRFCLFRISLGILAALALALSPQAAFAQRAGGHAGGGHMAGGGHFSGGGHMSGGAGFGRSGSSRAASHVASPIHVFSGSRSAPAAAASARAAENSAAVNGSGRGAAVALGSSNTSASSSSTLRGLGMFADPRGSSQAAIDARRSMPLHTTIGFPPSTDPHLTSIASAHRGAPLMFSGQGQQVWQSSQRAAANRSSVRATEMPRPQRAFPNPPVLPRRPFLGGAPFLLSSPGFLFFTPGFGFFGPGFGFGCDPFFAPSFGCGGFSPFGFGGFGLLGFGGGFAGGFGDAGFGYDGGYYAPPSFYVTPPNVDEGASEEPAPSEWQNPPAENSGVDNSAPAPNTVIYLKDGTSFAVKDYWVADGKLHYVTSYGGANAVELGDVDLQRTTDENASRGVSITLRPTPESQPPAAPSLNAQPPLNPQPPTQ